MLKDYEIDKPVLETDRLIIRVLNENDTDDFSIRYPKCQNGRYSIQS